MIEKVCLFLSGRHDELIKRVEELMHQAAEERNFEKAARLRDSINALRKVTTQQKVMSERNLNQDVIAIADEQEGRACAQVLIIRNGRLIGQEYFMLTGSEDEEREEILASFLQQFYEQGQQVPDELLLDTVPVQAQLLEEWLKGLKGKKVFLTHPERGEKKRLLEMAVRNAEENLKKEKIKEKYLKKRTVNAVSELAEHLNLEERPLRIEGFDISNIQGTDPVASMVVFKEGRALKSDYRRFKIKTVEGPDDFAMMQEVIRRRYSRVLREEKKLPNLILIDGGKGQLNAALKVLEELGLEGLSIIGLAKREEEVFLPGRNQPVIIPRGSAALHLLQRVRDEAHRFAVSYHRKLRSRRLTHTMLEDIPGVGPTRRQALLQYFGSLGEIRKAGIEELQDVEGISSKTARVIYDYLRENLRP